MVTWGAGEKTPFELTSGIKCPVLFHFGEIDENPSQEDMAKFDAELGTSGHSPRVPYLCGADHAFMDHTGPGPQQAAADASWPRTLAFFGAHL